MHSNRFLTIAAAGTIALAAAPLTADESVEDLREQVAELRAEVASLRHADDQQWLTEQRADAIRELVQDVLADADTRASLQDSGMTAGWDKKFFLKSADGNFLLTVGGQLQFRWVYNHRDVPSSGAIDDVGDPVTDQDRWGFENRRTKLKFAGHVVDPSWRYEVSGAFDRSGGEFELEDASIEKELDGGWALQFGQFKGPFMREALVSSSRQLAVERSLMNGAFNQGRSLGVQLGWTGDALAFKVMYSDGFDTANTSALTEDTEISLTGRVEWLGAGSWKQFKDFTSWSGEEFGWMLGGAFHYAKGESGTGTPPPPTPVGIPSYPASGDEELYLFTADISMEFGGANFFASMVYRHYNVQDLDQWGVVVQGGFFVVPDEWEIFARFEYIDADDAISAPPPAVPPGTRISDLNGLTVGFNRYWAKHGLKWTTDVGVMFDEVSSFFASSGAGYRSDAIGQDSQVVIRSQFQLLF